MAHDRCGSAGAAATSRLPFGLHARFVFSLVMAVIAGLLATAAPARADVPRLTMKQLLSVQDPSAPRAGGSAARLQLAASETATAEDTAADDDETPSALTGAPSAVDETEATAQKPVRMDEEESSVFKTWWFWALTAAVIGGTVALGVWAAQPEEQPAGLCSPNVIACFGDGR